MNALSISRLSSGFFLMFALTLVCAPILAPSHAHANGRPPQATGFATPSQLTTTGSPNTAIVALTFGVGVSVDSQKSYQWVCEDALGGPTSIDAVIAAPSSDNLLVGGIYGLRASHDGGCSWRVASEFTDLQVEALALHPSDSNSWWVVANGSKGATGTLWLTQDRGQSYQQQTGLKTQGLYYYGVAVSPANPSRILVTAGNNGNGNSCFLLASDDKASTWAQSNVSTAPSASVTPRVSISPTDAKRFLVAAIDAASSGTRLSLSTDGGNTYALVATLPEEVRNIVFSPDGTKVFAAGTTHVFRSENAGQSFEQLNVPSGNACASIDSGRLYACGDANQDGFSLGLSHDWGDSWDRVFSVTNLEGPYRCPQGTTTRDVCMAQWNNEAALIGARPEAVTASSAGHEGGCHCSQSGQPMGKHDMVSVGMSGLGLLAWYAWRRSRLMRDPR